MLFSNIMFRSFLSWSRIRNEKLYSIKIKIYRKGIAQKLTKATLLPPSLILLRQNSPIDLYLVKKCGGSTFPLITCFSFWMDIFYFDRIPSPTWTDWIMNIIEIFTKSTDYSKTTLRSVDCETLVYYLSFNINVMYS